MRRKWQICLLACAITFFFDSACSAGPARPPSIQDEVDGIRYNVARSELVILGKVREILDKTVVAAVNPDGIYRYEFRVAVIEVQEVLLGSKELKEVKLGFRTINRPTLKKNEPGVGLEACFMLEKHFEQDFYQMISLSKLDYPNYKRDMTQVKLAAKGLSDPLTALKSKVIDDRLVASAMLIARYRGYSRRGYNVLGGAEYLPPAIKNPADLQAAVNNKSDQPKLEPINADESKLILRTLAEADWTTNPNSTMPSPMKMFIQLGVGPDDGFILPPFVYPNMPKNVAPQPRTWFNGTPEDIAIAKAWLEKSAESYRIKKIVYPEK